MMNTETQILLLDAKLTLLQANASLYHLHLSSLYHDLFMKSLDKKENPKTKAVYAKWANTLS